MTNLKKVSCELGYTQTEIAEIIETEQTHYSAYELEKYIMGIDKYIKLALFYNVSLDYLCGLTDIPRTLTGISYADNILINKRQKAKKRGRE